MLLSLRLKQPSVALTRSAHTRAKKITVQATKDFGKRFQGEVFSVSEGHMRLKLHPEGLASYVLKNQPLKLPELSAKEAQQRRKELTVSLKAAQQAEESADSQPVQETQEDQQLKKVKSFLDNLSFPTANAASVASDASTSQADSTSGTNASKAPSSDNAETGTDRKKFSWQNKFVADIIDKK